MIRFENVSLSYGGAAAVRDLNFTVGRGRARAVAIHLKAAIFSPR